MKDEEFYRVMMREEWWYKMGSRRHEFITKEDNPYFLICGCPQENYMGQCMKLLGKEPPEVKMFWDEFHKRYGGALSGIMDNPSNPIFAGKNKNETI